MNHIPQTARLFLFIAYVGLLSTLARWTVGTWLPLPDEHGLWFYSGVAALLAGVLIDAPIHTTPTQALSVAFGGLLAMSAYATATWQSVDRVGRFSYYVGLAILGACLVAAMIAMVLKDSTGGTNADKLRESGYAVAAWLGRPATAISVVFLFALFAYERRSGEVGVEIVTAWSILVFARPLEALIQIGQRLAAVWLQQLDAGALGDVVGHGAPGLVTVRHPGPASVSPGTPLLVLSDDGSPNVALALTYVGFADGMWLRAIQLRLPNAVRRTLPSVRLEELGCSVISDPSLLEALEQTTSDLMSRRANLVGVVAPGSDTRTLRLEVARTDLRLEEGRLLETEVAGNNVTYQLLNGITKEEVLERKNTRGYVVADARKIGRWNEHARAFERVRWVPQPNAPVFLVDDSRPGVDDRAIGFFPGTSYPVYCNVSEMVTHNAAILGILGVGKTFLALELVERMMLDGIRVICLDLTDQYVTELAPYVDRVALAADVSRLQEVGKAGEHTVRQNVQEGGSIREFSGEVDSIVNRFLSEDGQSKLLVLNPNSFEVWRQDSKPFNNQASMAMLTAAEITKIVSQAALAACQQLGIVGRARCCLVYEEAHSLIPEWNAVAHDGDKAAANGTARAILQGRKFGLGCLLITQRTASVTKTVLNQCNTIFAMRVFDATGMDFLANYIGDEYAGILSGLADRHAIVFGKASSCADPVLIRVNDREAILPALRRLG